MTEELTPAQRDETKTKALEIQATVRSVINLLGPDRPMCPKDLSESQKYELIIESALDILRGIDGHGDFLACAYRASEAENVRLRERVKELEQKVKNLESELAPYHKRYEEQRIYHVKPYIDRAEAAEKALAEALAVIPKNFIPKDGSLLGAIRDMIETGKKYELNLYSTESAVRDRDARIAELEKVLKRVARRLMDFYSDIQNPKGVTANRLSKWMRKLTAECRESLAKTPSPSAQEPAKEHGAE